ncbi:hypothetical protein [Agrobacterium tumefaciens]|uniref:hypothetical protein n=1 Tax=Agrobacterium tumefaciens TaxID=358 RepID=UPI00097638F4|nr:hypothetical protein BV900_14840 [Agrobacterium tumefaciens]
MTELNDQLAAAGIKRILIVDDVFDPVPTSSDLAIDGQAWTNFFDDLRKPDRSVLEEIFAEYAKTEATELPSSNAFVAALWNAQARFRAEHIDPLFERYRADMKRDEDYAAQLQTQLETLGLECQTAGRDFEAKVASADLIIIDLFLGSQQDDGAIDLSKSVLKKAVTRRKSNPPLVLLMSRSGRLEQKREEFRDQAGLLESGFRIVRKNELADSDRLSALLLRFASHRTDFLKLAQFLESWETSALSAVARTSGMMRALDLSDYGQVRQLLLSTEGEPTGNYVVDIFDRVLQHEVESEVALIDAAIQLNAVTSEQYPPPHLAGSGDLQHLMHKTLFQHSERLRLAGAEGSKVAFGDVLRLRAGVDPKYSPVSDITANNVLVVLTPACDLQRLGAKRVLFLIGTLKSLGPADWKYDDGPAKTPVIELDDGRFWIQWDLKFIETLSHMQVNTALEDKLFEHVARLRENHALEIQQKMLSNLGRVGMPAMMPATFPVTVDVCYLGPDKVPVRIDVAGLDAGGVCYVGRDSTNMLVLTEPLCDAIHTAYKAVDVALVHENARPAFEKLRSGDELTIALSRAVKMPGPSSQSPVIIPSPTVTEGNPQAIGFIARNRKDDQAFGNAEVSKAGIVILTRDVNPG